MNALIKILGILLLVNFASFCGKKETWFKDFKPTKETHFMKIKKGFAAQLQIVSDQSFFENWNKPGLFVQIPVTKKAEIGIPVFPIILFSNPGKGRDGKCNVTCDFIVRTPSGKKYGEHKNGNVWVNMPAPQENTLQLGIDYMGITIEPKDPNGRYRVEAIVRDKNKGVKLKLVQFFTVEKGGKTQKEKTPEQFFTEEEYKNAKAKLLEWIRNMKYKVPESLIQRSSEDIYALIDFARKKIISDDKMKKDLFELFSVADSAGMYGAGLVAKYFSTTIGINEYHPQTVARQGYQISFKYPNYTLSIPSVNYNVSFPYYFMFFKLEIMNVRGGYDSTYFAVLSTAYGKGSDEAPSQASISIAICKTNDLEGFFLSWSKSYTGNIITVNDMENYGEYWEKQISLQNGQMSSLFKVREKNKHVQIIAYLGLNGTFIENLREFLDLNFFP